MNLKIYNNKFVRILYNADILRNIDNNYKAELLIFVKKVEKIINKKILISDKKMIEFI